MERNKMINRMITQRKSAQIDNTKCDTYCNCQMRLLLYMSYQTTNHTYFFLFQLFSDALIIIKKNIITLYSDLIYITIHLKNTKRWI